MADAAAGSRYAEFGETETLPLTKAQRLAGAYLTRNWSTIPHVTHSDEANVTPLEALRQTLKTRFPDHPITSLSFHVKAVVAALKAFPKFNASLDETGDCLILKKYFNIGIAVDTPQGLLVPVIRDVDKKSIPIMALEIATSAAKARSKGLSLAEMSGGCFSISSLGKNGGVSFTPIINAPEVAILGISRLQERPSRQGDQIGCMSVLPLSLSYDHRVINGAEAAAFMSHLVHLLENPDASWTD